MEFVWRANAGWMWSGLGVGDTGEHRVGCWWVVCMNGQIGFELGGGGGGGSVCG